MSELLDKVLTTQGFSPFLIVLMILIWVFYWMPYVRERDKQSAQREQERDQWQRENEERRLNEDIKHRSSLMQQMANDREKNAETLAEQDRRHAQERRELHNEHRQDMSNLMVLQERLIEKIDKSLASNTDATRRVGGLVISLSESMGKDKGDIIHRANQISGTTQDPDMYKTRPGV